MSSYSSSTLLTCCDVLRNLSHWIYYCKSHSSAWKDPVWEQTGLQETSENIRAVCLITPSSWREHHSFCFCMEFCQGTHSCPGLGSPGVTTAAFLGLTPRPKPFHLQNTQSLFSKTDVKPPTQNVGASKYPQRLMMVLQAPSMPRTDSYSRLCILIIESCTPKTCYRSSPGQQPFSEWRINLQWRKNPLVLNFRAAPTPAKESCCIYFRVLGGCSLTASQFQTVTQLPSNYLNSALRGINLRNQGQRFCWWCSNCWQILICDPSQSSCTKQTTVPPAVRDKQLQQHLPSFHLRQH